MPSPFLFPPKVKQHDESLRLCRAALSVLQQGAEAEAAVGASELPSSFHAHLAVVYHNTAVQLAQTHQMQVPNQDQKTEPPTSPVPWSCTQSLCRLRVRCTVPPWRHHRLSGHRTLIGTRENFALRPLYDREATAQLATPFERTQEASATAKLAQKLAQSTLPAKHRWVKHINSTARLLRDLHISSAFVEHSLRPHLTASPSNEAIHQRSSALD